MIKDLLSCSLDYSICAEVALALFVIDVLWSILYGTLRLSRSCDGSMRVASLGRLN